MKHVQTDWRQAELCAADNAMLEYTEKLTLRPMEMVEKDVDALREVGFSDAAVLDINQITGYFAFVNRVALGLGVELEEFWPEAV